MMEKLQSAEPSSEQENIYVKSNLTGLRAERAELRIARGPDGKPPAAAFFDIDLTFLELEEVLYPEVRRRLWPNIEHVDKVHLAGFRLGTMFKEMYRMKMLNDYPYDRRYASWADENAYEADFLANEGVHINEPGDSYHEMAAAELARFDAVATQVVKEVREQHPESFEQGKIGPVYQLAEEYRRLGVPIVGMTANPRGFILEILKDTGLSEIFFECATDDDVPGDKEYKMLWLIEKMEQAGIPVPYDHIEVIGDSVTGDVGSGPRFEQLMRVKQPAKKVITHGLLIVESEEALSKARAKLATKPELEQQLVGETRAQALRWDKVTTSEHGTFNMTQKYRKDFLEPVVVAK